MKVQKLTKSHRSLDGQGDSNATEQDFTEPDEAEYAKCSNKAAKKYGDGVEVS